MQELYKLSKEYQELATLAEAEEMKEAVSDTMEALEGEFSDKAQALTTVLLNMDGEIEAIDNAIERLKTRKAVMEHRQHSMKEYLRDNMERCDIQKIACPLFTITCAKGREIVVIDQELDIPDEYMAVETKLKPNKTELAKALKEGKEIPGARLERSKSSIRIK